MKCEWCGRKAGVIKNYPGRTIAIIVKKAYPTWPNLCQYCRAKMSKGG